MAEFAAYNSKWRVLLLVLGSMIFVAIGLWMIGAFGPAPSSGRYDSDWLAFVGWFAVLFFGLCSVLWVRRLFIASEQIRIDRTGIYSRQWSDDMIPWSEITSVTTWTYRGQDVIVIHLREPARYPGKGVAALFAPFSKAISGGDIGISLTGTNRTFKDALAAIEQLRPDLVSS